MSSSKESFRRARDKRAQTLEKTLDMCRCGRCSVYTLRWPLKDCSLGWPILLKKKKRAVTKIRAIGLGSTLTNGVLVSPEVLKDQRQMLCQSEAEPGYLTVGTHRFEKKKADITNSSGGDPGYSEGSGCACARVHGAIRDTLSFSDCWSELWMVRILDFWSVNHVCSFPSTQICLYLALSSSEAL